MKVKKELLIAILSGFLCVACGENEHQHGESCTENLTPKKEQTVKIEEKEVTEITEVKPVVHKREGLSRRKFDPKLVEATCDDGCAEEETQVIEEEVCEEGCTDHDDNVEEVSTDVTLGDFTFSSVKFTVNRLSTYRFTITCNNLPKADKIELRGHIVNDKAEESIVTKATKTKDGFSLNIDAIDVDKGGNLVLEFSEKNKAAIVEFEI